MANDKLFMDKETVRAIEHREIIPSFSIFNMGSLEEKLKHTERLGNTNYDRWLHLDMFGDEVYTMEQIAMLSSASNETPVQIHPMLTMEEMEKLGITNFEQLAGMQVWDFAFHPSLIPNWVEVALTATKYLKCTAVIDHNTTEEIYKSDSLIFDPNLFSGVMVMTVKYGQSGQKYDPNVETVIKKVRQRLDPNQHLWVDGGITDKTVPFHLGIDGVVSASYLAKAENSAEAVKKLTHPDIAIGCDHAGYELKQRLIEYLRDEKQKTVFDAGTYTAESCKLSDYPYYARAVGNMVAEGRADRGILVCGSGIGMSMAANKVKGIRAALCRSTWDAAQSRQHNDANVLCLGSRAPCLEGSFSTDYKRITDCFLIAQYESGRHQRRIDKIENR